MSNVLVTLANLVEEFSRILAVPSDLCDGFGLRYDGNHCVVVCQAELPFRGHFESLHREADGAGMGQRPRLRPDGDCVVARRRAHWLGWTFIGLPAASGKQASQ